MLFKIDTKEKFHAITIQEPQLSANMTEDLDRCLLPLLQQDVKNVVLVMQDVTSLDSTAARCLVQIQQQFYEQEASFVICTLQPAVEDFLEKEELLELMNVTPTESEAWDIVQMEEIERELLGGDDIS